MANDVTIIIRGVDKASAVIEDIQDKLSFTANTQTRDLARGFGAVEAALDRLADRIDSAMDGLSGGVTEVAEETGKAKTAMEAYGGTIVSIATKGRAAILGLGQAVSSAAQSIGSTFGGILSGLGDSVGGIGGGRLQGNLFSGIIETARNAANTVARGVVSIAKGTVNAVAGIVSGAAKLIGGLADSLGKGLGGIVGLIAGGPGGGLIGLVLGGLVGSIPKALAEAISGIVGGVAQSLSGVADLIGGVFEAGVNLAAQALNTLVGVVSGVVEKIGAAFGSLVERIGGIFGSIVSKASLVLVGVSGFAARQSIKFRDQMAVTFGLVAEEGPEAFKQMVTEVRQVMADTPFISWEEGARGLFQAISFGIRDPMQRMEALRASVDLAVGGGMKDLGISMQSIARLMDQFGVSAQEAADRIFTFQNQASLSVADIAGGIGQIIGTARITGQSLNEIGAAMTFISRALTPEETFVSLNRALLTFIEVDAAEKFQEMGISIRDATGALRPLSEIVSQIRDRGLKDVELRALFPNVRAFRAFPPLLKASREEFDAMLESMQDFEGAMADAAAVVRDQLGAQISSTWSGFVAIVDKVVGRIQGPLVDGLKSVRDAMRSFRDSTAFEAMVTGIQDVGAAIFRGLGDAFNFMRDNWSEVERIATRVMETTRDLVMGTYGVLRELFAEAKAASGEGGAFETIRKTWEGIRDTLTEVRDGFKAAARGDVTPLKNLLGDVWTTFENAAKSAWDSIRIAALDTLGDIAIALSGLFSGGGVPAGVKGRAGKRGPSTALHGAGGGEVRKLAGGFDLDVGSLFGGMAKDAATSAITEKVNAIGGSLRELGEDLKRQAAHRQAIQDHQKEQRRHNEWLRKRQGEEERLARFHADNAAENAKRREELLRQIAESAKVLDKPLPPVSQGGAMGGPEVDRLRARQAERKRQRKLDREAMGFKDELLEAEAAGAGPQEFAKFSPGQLANMILQELAAKIRGAGAGVGGQGAMAGDGRTIRRRGPVRSFEDANRQTFGGKGARLERLRSAFARMGGGQRKEARGIFKESKAAGLELPVETILEAAQKGGRKTEEGREVLARALERQAKAIEQKSEKEGDEFQTMAEKLQTLADAIREAKDANEGLLKAIVEELERAKKDTDDKAAGDREKERRVKNTGGKK